MINLATLLGSKKLLYTLVGALLFVFFISMILILGNVGQGTLDQATLEFWGVFDTRQNFAEVASSFQQIFPGIKINYKQFSFEDYEKALVDALAAGIGPDIMMIHNTWLAKHIDKISAMPEASGVVENYKFMTPTEFQGQFVDVAYEDMVKDSKIYGFPLYVDTLALYYNRDMLNTAGITRPPKNWDEFNEDVEILTKFDQAGNIIQAGAAMGTARNINRSSDILAALMIQNGTQMTNPTNTATSLTRTVNSQRVGENALEYYTDFANRLKTVYTWNDQQHYSVDAFIEGKVAMMFNYSHQIPIVRGRFERLNFAIAPLPQFSELDSKNYANYWGVGVSGQSRNKDAAWRFLSYLTSKEGAMTYLGSVSRPSARRDLIEVQKNDPSLGVFAVQALSARSWYQVDNNAIDQIFADMIDNVNSKKETVRAALRTAESKITTLMTRRP